MHNILLGIYIKLNVPTNLQKRRVRYACLDADTRFMRILQLQISSPLKQSHFVKWYRGIVFGSISGGFQGSYDR